MLDKVLSRASIWLSAVSFDRAINAGICILVAYLMFSLALILVGINPWSESSSLIQDSGNRLDLYFGAIYTAIAILYAQNLLFFYQTREQLFKDYCLYITFVAISIATYPTMLSSLSIPLNNDWARIVTLTTQSIALVFVIRFARRLLDLERHAPKTDGLLKLGMIFYLLTFVVTLPFDSLKYFVIIIFDMAVWFTFGAILLFASWRVARAGDTVALIFFFSYLAHYVGLIWSYSILIFSKQTPTLSQFYVDDPAQAEAAIWFSALALEALLMSLAAQYQLRESKAATALAQDRSLRLERAVRIAQARLEDQSQGTREQAQSKGYESLESALRDLIVDNAAESFVDVSFLSKAMAMSRATLLRRLKEETGQSPSALIRQVRLEIAHDLMTTQKARTVGEAMLEAGFSSMGHFAKAYRDAFGESPADTLKGA